MHQTRCKMGIPFYFRTITQKHPNLICRSIGEKVVDGLFLDLNCAIHQCARDALNDAAHGSPASAIENDIISRTIAYVDKLVDYVKPQNLLYVAIDGPPPRAKMSQQRKRRFLSAWREDICGHDGVQWDRNAITPGTKFMEDLSAALRAHLDMRITKNTNNRSSPSRTMFLDSNDPGEGEAKIFRELRKCDMELAKPNSAIVVYGLDADLIMLSLIAEVRHPIFLLREASEFDAKQQQNMHAKQPFMYFDTRALAKAIDHRSSTTTNTMKTTSISVDDYVVLCFLLGNDFIPPLSFLKINNNGIEVLLQHYERVKIDNTDKLVYVDNSGTRAINYTFLLAIFERLRDTEDVCLNDADKAYYAYVPQRVPTAQAAAMDARAAQTRFDNYPSCNKFVNVVRPNTTGWRPRYYYHLFYKMTDAKDIDAVCSNYLQGIQWTFDYYFQTREPSWGWYYKYDYSPTASDLFNHATSHLSQCDASPREILREAIEDPTHYYNFHPASLSTTELTQTQLLMVLPASSFHLLPQSLRAHVGAISHLYPKTFSVTTYLKKFIWESHPILPLIDMTDVHAIVLKAQSVIR